MLVYVGGGGIARGNVVVTVFPALQFVRQGVSAELKARVHGGGSSGGLVWQVLEPAQGSLEVVGQGRVTYRADSVQPWSRAVVRATSTEDPSSYQDAVIEVLPHQVFQVVERVLGTDWLEDHCENRPAPIRLEVVEPGSDLWPAAYTIHAEIDTAEPDRFEWAIQPDQGKFSLTYVSEDGRESCHYIPPEPHPGGMVVRVTVKSKANSRHVQEASFRLPGTRSGEVPVYSEFESHLPNWHLMPERRLKQPRLFLIP